MVLTATKNKRGFTLVETILAGAILCGAVLVLGSGINRVMAGSKLNREYETALQLADRQLTLIDYIGIEDFIRLGKTEGEFIGYEPVYRWEVVTETGEIDNLYKLNITVSWVKQKRLYSVSVDTILNGTGKYIETE